MIRSLSANDPRFERIEFGPGMNMVLADRTRESTRTDSRNGLGKSTLIELIHFMLGSSGELLLSAPLEGWTFSMELTVADQQMTVHRSIDRPKVVEVEVAPGTRQVLQLEAWTRLLGSLMFGLDEESSSSLAPSFRSLISYFARRTEGYDSPFEHFRKQKEWQIQLDNMFLLGLDWTLARSFQGLKERETLLKSLRRAPQAGLMSHLAGDIGELDAECVRLRDAVQSAEAQLKSFQVHPQYREIEQKANELTETIHELSNLNLVERRTVELYEKSLAEEAEPAPVPFDVAAIYEEAKLKLPGMVVRHLEEAEEFHRKLIENRRLFLKTEIERLKSSIRMREESIQQRSLERAELLNILRTHTALDEYNLLQARQMKAVADLRATENRLKSLRELKSSQSQIRVEREQLFLRTLADNEERRMIKERAQSLFRENTEALYGSPPGLLIIDTAKTGYKFTTEIRREGSSGVNRMKIFCYDLTLAQLWSKRERTPGLLIHDSAIFDGVDERQRALALERAAWSAAQFGHQYICTFNSDMLPATEFSPGFSIDPFVCRRLTDERPAGSLFGFRFERWKPRVKEGKT